MKDYKDFLAQKEYKVINRGIEVDRELILVGARTIWPHVTYIQ